MGDLWEIFEYVGEALVFLGVVGEVFAEWKEPHRRRLGRISSIVLIAGLGLSLAALFGTNEHFNRTIADLNLRASQAIEQAAKNEAEAATQRAHAAKDEKDLAELRKESMPRVIDEDRLASKVSRFSGTPVDLATIEDFDSMQLTRAIKDALIVKAHWKTGAMVNIAWAMAADPVPIELAQTGIWIEAPLNTSKSQRLKSVAEALAAALRQEGIEAHTRRGHTTSTFNTPTPDGAIRLYVSLKPFPGMPEDLRVISER